MGYKEIIDNLDATFRSSLERGRDFILERLENVFRRKTGVGIDIGSRAIKAIKLSSVTTPPTIEKVIYAPLSASSTSEEIIPILHEIMVSLGGDEPLVAVSLAGESVVVRNIRLPRMTKDELKDAMRFEADKYIPFSIADVNYDFHVLEDELTDGKMHVLLVAAKKEVLQERVSLLQQGGMECTVVDVDSCALVNAFQQTRPEDEWRKCVALLDVGASITNFVIAEAALPFFVRDIMLGGSDITQAISEDLSVTIDEAEQIKCDPEHKCFAEGQDIVQAIFEELADEIQSCFDYYESQMPHPVECMYVCGGGAKSQRLIPYLKEILKIDVIPWNPLEGVTCTPQIIGEVQPGYIAGEFAIAYGLAAR